MSDFRITTFKVDERDYDNGGHRLGFFTLEMTVGIRITGCSLTYRPGDGVVVTLPARSKGVGTVRVGAEFSSEPLRLDVVAAAKRCYLVMSGAFDVEKKGPAVAVPVVGGPA